MAVFSFHPVKAITTGEGGAVVTNRKDLYDKLLMLRNHGVTRDAHKYINRPMKDAGWYYEMQGLGYNYRITDFQCALGVSQLSKIGKFTKKREKIAKFYNAEFSGIKSVWAPTFYNNALSAWHLYCLRINSIGSIKDKIRVFNELKKRGIGVQVHYIPLYLHPYYKKMGYKSGLCPNAEKFYLSTFSLPIYYSISDKDMKRVVETVKNILK